MNQVDESEGEKNTMLQKVMIAIVMMICLSLTACVRQPGGISPSNIPITQDGYRTLGKVEVSDCKINLFGLIPISSANYLWDAVDEAQRQIPGTDGLVNITVDRVSKYFILWSQTCTEVRATAVRLK